MNKKRYTVKWLALLIQVAFLFFVFIGSSYAIDNSDCQKRWDGDQNKITECQKCLSSAGVRPSARQTCLYFPNTDTAGCIIYAHGDPQKVRKCFMLHNDQAKNIVRFLLIPLQFLITYLAYIMGFFFLAWGLYRLRHAHEGGGAMRQSSGTGSFLCFLAAALLFQYQYAVKLIGVSFLGPRLRNQISWDYSTGSEEIGEGKTLPIDPPNLFGYYSITNCVHGAGEKDAKACYASDVIGDSERSGILASQGNSMGWGDAQDEYSTLETLFATLMIIGFISFVRGAMLVVKAGEGMHAGESTGTKAVTHILAGGLLCNANHVASVLNNVIENSQKSGIS